MSSIEIKTQTIIPNIKISTPVDTCVCCGTKNKMDEIKIVSNRTREIKALFGSVAIDKIFARLMETPTKIKPVNAAAEPAVAAKKSFQSVILYVVSLI